MKLKRIKVQNKRSLTSLLKKHHLIGTGHTVSQQDISALLEYLRGAKLDLIHYKGGLAAVEHIVVVDISVAINDSLTKHLVEKRRYFRNGKLQLCDHDDGIGLRMTSGESPRAAAKRCLTEKIQTKANVVFSPPDPKDTRTEEIATAKFWPIRLLLRVKHVVRGKMQAKDHDPNGYHRRRHGKNHSTYFFWKPQLAKIIRRPSGSVFICQPIL